MSIFDSTLLDRVSGQPVLITGDSGNQDLLFTLLNNQEQVIQLTPFTSGRADQNHYHLKVDFAPPALTNPPMVTDWDVYAATNESGGIESLYLAYNGDQALNIDQKKPYSTTLSYSGATQVDSGNSTVDVRFTTGDQVTLGDRAIPNTSFGPILLTLVHANTPHMSVPPLAVDFVGRRT